MSFPAGLQVLGLVWLCCLRLVLLFVVLRPLFLPLSFAVLTARLLGGIWEHKKKEPVALSVVEEIQALGVLFVGGGVLLP